jgi:oligopeptidase A
MATLATAEKLLEEMRAVAYPVAAKELQELRAFARSQGETRELQWWDMSFWGEKLRAAKYDFSEEALKPYLELSNVLKGMFKVRACGGGRLVAAAAVGFCVCEVLKRLSSLSPTNRPTQPNQTKPTQSIKTNPKTQTRQLAKRLFDVEVVPADGMAQTWHPDVKFFEVRATNGTPIAYLYLDPFSRPAEKRQGAWMDSVIPRSSLMAPAGANVRLPVAVAVCNQMGPVGGGPALLTLRDVSGWLGLLDLGWVWGPCTAGCAAVLNHTDS